MGTNFYFYFQKPCECCKREFPPLHIGKSSYGWAFALHVIPANRVEWEVKEELRPFLPEDGINSLEDWQKLWSRPGTFIEDEYGDPVSPEKMTMIITCREGHYAPLGRLMRAERKRVGRDNLKDYDLIMGEFG